MLMTITRHNFKSNFTSSKLQMYQKCCNGMLTCTTMWWIFSNQHLHYGSTYLIKRIRCTRRATTFPGDKICSSPWPQLRWGNQARQLNISWISLNPNQRTFTDNKQLVKWLNKTNQLLKQNKATSFLWMNSFNESINVSAAKTQRKRQTIVTQTHPKTVTPKTSLTI